MTKATARFYTDELSFGLPLCEEDGLALLESNPTGFRDDHEMPNVPCAYCAHRAESIKLASDEGVFL